MEPGGFTAVAQGLYSESFGLQITPRRRKQASITNNVLAGLQGGTTVLNVALDAADTLQAGDGLLIDFILAKLSAAAPGLVMVQLAFAIEDTTQTKTIPIGQGTLTTLSVGAVPTAAVLSPTPPLWSAIDIGFGLNNQPAAVPATDQPLKLTLIAIANNPTGAAINLTTQLVCFYRIVRGLQEG